MYVAENFEFKFSRVKSHLKANSDAAVCWYDDAYG